MRSEYVWSYVKNYALLLPFTDHWYDSNSAIIYNPSFVEH